MSPINLTTEGVNIIISTRDAKWVFENNEKTASDLISQDKLQMLQELCFCIKEITTKNFSRKLSFGYIKENSTLKQGEEVPDDMKIENYQPGCWLVILIEELGPFYCKPLTEDSLDVNRIVRKLVDENDDLKKEVFCLKQKMETMIQTFITKS